MVQERDYWEGEKKKGARKGSADEKLLVTSVALVVVHDHITSDADTTGASVVHRFPRRRGRRKEEGDVGVTDQSRKLEPFCNSHVEVVVVVGDSLPVKRV